MPIGILYWMILIIWFLFGLYWHRTDMAGGNYGIVGGNLILLVLFGLIGWKLFGPILQ